MKMELVKELVAECVAANDASHDMQHIERVRNMALKIAQLEGADASSLTVIELAAYLHDIEDYKYSGSDDAAYPVIHSILSRAGYSSDISDRVCTIIKGVSYHSELGSSAEPPSIELACVQDADRLDAIGAIGIARCLTFGGAKHRVLHDASTPPAVGLTKEQYMASTPTTINHFYEKLLLLKDKMKTKSGRDIAQARHEYMVGFLQQFHAEWAGER